MHSPIKENGLPARFVVTVQFGIAPQHYASFMREMLTNARNSREREPGCIVFDVCEDPARPGDVFLYEIYQDAAAFEQHKREAHFLDFERVVAPWVTRKTVKILSLLAVS
ncbi:MAG: putative quinol monooxygenase [Burkholderiaceae bacterium]